jgi:hypothetical protein
MRREKNYKLIMKRMMKKRIVHLKFYQDMIYVHVLYHIIQKMIKIRLNYQQYHHIIMQLVKLEELEQIIQLTQLIIIIGLIYIDHL